VIDTALPEASTAILPPDITALAEVPTCDDLMLLREKAELARQMARRRKLAEQQNEITIYKIRIGREIHARLKQMTIPPRGRWSVDKTTGQMQGAERSLPEGINANDAWICRRLGAPPDVEFERWVAGKTDAGEEITEKAWLVYCDAFIRCQQGKLAEDEDVDHGTTDDDTSDYTERTVLMTTKGEHDKLVADCDRLSDSYGTDNLTDTVLECVRQAVEAL
jgi:hypothetical protein